jgi:hypothetical protein
VDFDPSTVFQAIVAGELSRAVAIAALLTWAVNQLKPLLPTGRDQVGRDTNYEPLEPIENRWVPLTVLALNILLNPLIAWAVNVGQGEAQSILESAFYGALLGFASVGAVRAINLTRKGDQAEQKAFIEASTVKALTDPAPPSPDPRVH